MRINNTEYVNAQAEDLKILIDDLAGSIEGVGETGLYGIKSLAHGETSLVVAMYEQDGRYMIALVGGTLRAASKTMSTRFNLPDAAKPSSPVVIRGAAYTTTTIKEDGTITIELQTNSRGVFHQTRQYK